MPNGYEQNSSDIAQSGKLEEFYVVSEDGRQWVYLGQGSLVLSESHRFVNEVVEFPLEDGSPLVDHLIILPDTLEIEIFTSNRYKDASRTLFETLKAIRNSRALVSVYTYHEIYRGMAVASVELNHVAPFKGQLSGVIRFQKIDLYNAEESADPRSKFKKTNTEEISREIFNPGSKVDSSAFFQSASNEALAKKEADWMNRNATKGILQKNTEVVDTASFIKNIGEKVESTTESATAAWGNISKRIYDAYGKAEQLKSQIELKLNKVTKNIQFISNLSIGAQRFSRSLGNQTLGFVNYFDPMTKNFGINLTDAQGKELISGAAFVLGANVIKGLNAKYPVVQNDGAVKNESLALKGLFMSPPISSVKNSTAYGIENTPAAFSQGADGIAPCVMFYFTDADAAKAYEELMLGLEIKQPNVKLEYLDYTIGR